MSIPDSHRDAMAAPSTIAATHRAAFRRLRRDVIVGSRGNSGLHEVHCSAGNAIALATTSDSGRLAYAATFFLGRTLPQADSLSLTQKWLRMSRPAWPLGRPLICSAPPFPNTGRVACA